MASTLTIAGPTFTNSVAKALPTIPALQTLCFFGTGYDGNNNNRAPGGPALSVKSGAPVYSSNFVSLGGAGVASIETNNPRSAAVLASGWTYATVARSTGSGSNQPVIWSEVNGTTLGSSMILLTRSSATYANFLFENAVRATLNTVTPTTNFHFAAATYSGGASGTWTLFDFTDDTVNGMPQTYAQTGFAAGAQSPHWGAIAADSTFQFPMDLAFGMVSFTPLNAAALSTLAASVRSFLARRGITC